MRRADQRSIVDLVEVGAEEQEGGQRGRADRVALGQRLGGVADGVERVGDLAGTVLRRLRELDDAAGVVGDRAEGVHGQDVGGGHEHAHRGDGGAEDAADVGAVVADEAGLVAEPVADDSSAMPMTMAVTTVRLEADRECRR